MRSSFESQSRFDSSLKTLHLCCTFATKPQFGLQWLLQQPLRIRPTNIVIRRVSAELCSQGRHVGIRPGTPAELNIDRRRLEQGSVALKARGVRGGREAARALRKCVSNISPVGPDPQPRLAQ